MKLERLDPTHRAYKQIKRHRENSGPNDLNC